MQSMIYDVILTAVPVQYGENCILIIFYNQQLKVPKWYLLSKNQF